MDEKGIVILEKFLGTARMDRTPIEYLMVERLKKKK